MRISGISQINNLKFKSVCVQQKETQTGKIGCGEIHVKIPIHRFYNIHKTSIVTLKNGVKALLINNHRNKSMYLTQDRDYLGGLTYSISDAYIKGDNYPNYYKDRKYLFINSIYSHQQFKGIGTELIKQAVQESKKRGLEGRVCLNTSTTKAEKGSPIPFYYKLGFECTNKEKDKLIKAAIKDKKKIPPSCESVTLFLPDEAIKRLSCDS